MSITAITLAPTAQSGLVTGGNKVLATSTFVQGGITREALAANFLANPNGHSFVRSRTGTIISTQGGQRENSLIGEAVNDACETSFLPRLAA